MFLSDFWETNGNRICLQKIWVTAETIDFKGFFDKSYPVTRLLPDIPAIYRKIFFEI